jgi:golgin subfamily B member 1
VRVKLAGVTETRLQDRERAIEVLRELLADARNREATWDDLERLYAQSGRNAELAELLAERVEHAAHSGDSASAQRKAWDLVGLREAALADADGAVVALQRLRTLSPQDARVLRELVRLHDKAGRHAEAAAALRELAGMQAGSDAVTTLLSLAELATGKLADAVLAEDALRSALALEPDHAVARQRLRAHLEATAQHGKLAALLIEDAEAAATPAEQAAAFSGVAAIYSGKLADPGRAVQLLERASALVPDDRGVLLALCDLYIAAQRQTDAVPVLEKIIASYAGRRAKEVAVYEHRLGQAYESAGQLDDALKHYDAAFKIDLTSVAVLRDLGRLCLERGDLDRAQKTYRALLLQKLGPELGLTKADVYFRLGEVSAKQGDKPKAKAMLERAISEAGQHPAAKAMLEQL